MKKVANAKVIRRLSFRTMKEKKWKNLIAILAIALNALLFTALFTVGGSLISTMEESTMRMVGTSAHGGYKYLSWQEYEQIKETGGFTEITYDIIAGFAVNPELSEIQTEVRYGEDRQAELSFAYPDQGHMPVQEKECVVSSKVLDALGIPRKIGVAVPLIISSHDENGREKVIREEFVLSGYYFSNNAAHAQELWVSRQWLEKNVPILQENYHQRMERVKGDALEGSIQAAVNFPSAYDIEGQMEKLTREAGLTGEVDISVNWAYATSKVDFPTLFLGIGLLAVILLSGYLIIYNIFYINVTADIRYYGLLKTIGVTGRQLRRLVRTQALLLSAQGIPLGLLGGWFVGRGILPFLYSAMDTDGVRRVSLHPWIFAGSAVFALVTVYLSCIRPCRLAAGVSPIEAVRFVEGNNGRYGKKPGKRQSKSGRLSAPALAAANLRRSRKKAAVVVASLSLSLMLINATYGLVKGISFDRYVDTYLVGDMQVGHVSTVNYTGNGVMDTEAVTPELTRMLQKTVGVEKITSAWYKPGYIRLSGEMLKRFDGYYHSQEFLKDHPSYRLAEAENLIREQKTYAGNYCLDETLLSELEISQGRFDREKFLSGGYVVLLRAEDEEGPDWWLTVGDKLTLGSYEDETTGERPKKELEVMAVGTIPFALTKRAYTTFSSELLLCGKDFEELYDTDGQLYACLTVEEGKEEQTAQAVEKLLKEYDPDLVLTTKETLRKEFAVEMQMFSVTGGLLSGILALIGALNMINAIITGILARRQEFAMMQAVGMTGRQLRRMLVWEGIWYGVWTLGIAATLGNLVSYGALYLMGKVMIGFEWSFQILPLLVSIPVMALLSLSVPVLCYHGLCRESIVERLRGAEI